jgi:hypothetical protein
MTPKRPILQQINLQKRDKKKKKKTSKTNPTQRPTKTLHQNDLAASSRTNKTKKQPTNIHQPNINKEYMQAGSTRSKVQGSPHSLETFLSQQL